MRVTDKVMQNNFLANLAFTAERLYEKETRVLTNKKINKPSDNPVDALNSLTIRKRIAEIEQYQRNISQSKSLLQSTESVVSQLNDVFQQVRTLTVQGASDSYNLSDKYSISYEIDQLLEYVFSASNTMLGSKYIFAGTSIKTNPYTEIRNAEGEITSVTSNVSSGDINRIIGEDISVKVNVNGEDLFERSENLFDILITIRDDLRSGDSDKIRQDLIKIDEASEKIRTIQSIIGSRTNRIESADSRSENDIINLTEFLSNTEDIDASKAIIDYQTELLLLQTTLQAGARILQPSLADFLR